MSGRDDWGVTWLLKLTAKAPEITPSTVSFAECMFCFFGGEDFFWPVEVQHEFGRQFRRKMIFLLSIRYAIWTDSHQISKVIKTLIIRKS